jgi:hypothetical protein
MQAAMREASRVVLDGFELTTDATAVRYPDRYMDDRGMVMWRKVMALLGQANGRLEGCPSSNRVLSFLQHPPRAATSGRSVQP